jgi:RimJ/RimL family protein N-acetyltransferase
MNPLLIDLPEYIETPRLILRSPRAGDGPELTAAITESFAELKEWMPWAKKIPTVEESEINARKAFGRWVLREDLRISMIDKSSGKLVGSTGLHRINWDLPSFEIGYWVRTSYGGKGYVKESTNALTRFAFEYLKAKRVEIRCESKNEKSLGVMKSLGFEYEGCLRSSGTEAHSTNPRDTLIYSLLNPSRLPPLEVKWKI